MCESRGSRPGLPVPNKLHSFCERKTTLNHIKCLLGNSSDGEVQGRSVVPCPETQCHRRESAHLIPGSELWLAGSANMTEKLTI